MSLVRARNLSFSYRETPVLDSVSFEVEAGSFVGLVGPNGSGKTTLLRMLQGLLEPMSGTIELEGRDLRQWPRREIALRVAGVWQRPTLAFEFTARQLVLLGRTPHMGVLKWETTEDLEIAEEVMRQTETLHLADRTATHMSAGELQRVFIASALAQRTRVLLLDEPTSFLDLRQAGRLSRILAELTECGLTILCASHDIPLVRRHATSVLLMEKGRPVVQGHPDDMLARERLAEAFDVSNDDWYHDSHVGD
jgi:iron complex transport system ATP-binding protein